MFLPEQSLQYDYSIYKSTSPFKRDYMEEKLFQALFARVFTYTGSQVLWIKGVIFQGNCLTN